MDFEALFEKCLSDQKYDEPKNMTYVAVDRLVENIESEYQGITTVHSDRQKEKETLKNDINAAEKKLNSIKNPTNLAKMTFVRREALSNKLAAARKELRQEIKRYKVRLDEIKIEEGDTGQEEKQQVDNVPTITTITNVDKPVDKWNMNPYSDFI